MTNMPERLRDADQYGPNDDVCLEAADMFDAIDALHQPYPHAPGVCRGCGGMERNWPCPTHRILHPEEVDQ